LPAAKSGRRKLCAPLADEMNIDWDSREITDLIDRALREDIGDGDVTSRTLFSNPRKISAIFLAKQEGILAGLPLVSRIFRHLDERSSTEEYFSDGTPIHPGTVFCKVSGDVAAILSGERLVLNFLQRLCGIATQTSFYARLADPFGIAVLDTRKTTPMLRSLEKYAVQVGGGTNHRFGLYDGILVKDNHLQLEPDFNRILALFRKQGCLPEKVEIEVTSIEMLKTAKEAGGLWFLLDNMSPDIIRKCVELKTKNMKFEVSGGVTPTNFAEYLIPGVDGISIGGLTHSFKSLDISMEMES
jgi:nicotinate-nucleotide pyrophosphorylase (carboxylating)